MDFHENGELKTELGIRVHMFGETRTVKVHNFFPVTYTAKIGDLDWSRGFTVVQFHYNEEGICIEERALSHKRKPYTLTFNPSKHTDNAVIARWQSLAWSPEARWIDGRAPTMEDVEKAYPDWLRRKEAPIHVEPSPIAEVNQTSMITVVLTCCVVSVICTGIVMGLLHNIG